jgi:DNA helicase HerA-like ATPase
MRLRVNLSNIRLSENIGIVANEAGTSKFNFFITPLLKKILIREGDYVLLDHPLFGEQCQVLAKVKKSENFEEVIGGTLERTVKSIASGEILGFVDLREFEKGILPLRDITIPVGPGNRVYLPKHDFLQEIFSKRLDGRPFENEIHLGEYYRSATDENGEVRSLDFNLDAAELCGQHTLITSMTGTGKTHTATVIAEEMANKYDRPIIVFDPHGEYATFGNYDNRVKGLYKKSRLMKKKYPFDFKVFIHYWDHKEVLRALSKRGEPTRDSRFSFKPLTVSKGWKKDPEDYSKLKIEIEPEKMVNKRLVTIIIMRGLPPEARTNLFTYIMACLYEARIENLIPPFFVVVEEAGNLASENKAVKLLQRISSEGVKNGVSMCLLSQHPAEMDRKVLSQTGMQIMGRTVFSRDIECLKDMAQEETYRLPNLRVGEWLINGIGIPKPRLIRIRDRYSNRQILLSPRGSRGVIVNDEKKMKKT